MKDRWYQAWLDSKCFQGRSDTGKRPYSIAIPPPNVTGVLHIGHVLNNSIQDVLIRRARLEGREACWIPGTDHASISTHSVVEKQLARDEGKTRWDIGREDFLKRAKDWQEKHGGIILKQLQAMGCSCDWDRLVFTMDPEYNRSVLSAFERLFKEGRIYRGKRMVNWCPATLTAISDEEVDMKPQKGILYKMRYEVVEEPGRFLEISTTRPETLMGDTGVAVHPADERYSDLVGKHVWRPFPREAIPIVEDLAIDIEFGTGVLKVTPAHDKVDYEIGLRHALPIVEVLNPDGTLNSLAGAEFDGMDRFEARKVATEKLRSLGLLVAEEPYENNVGFSQRAGVPDRASPDLAVVDALSEGRRSQESGRRRADQVLPRALDQGLYALVEQYPGLVHQSSALVGATHTRLVPQGHPLVRADRGGPEGFDQGPCVG